MRVLITGMSGTGKSAVVRELRRQGFSAYDADDDGFTEPGDGGAWRWRVDGVAALLASNAGALVFFAGCSDEQTAFDWDRKILLTAPEQVIGARLLDRSSNDYGKSEQERAQALQNLREFEPLLRRGADVVIDATQPLGHVVAQVVASVAPIPGVDG